MLAHILEVNLMFLLMHIIALSPKALVTCGCTVANFAGCTTTASCENNYRYKFLVQFRHISEGVGDSEILCAFWTHSMNLYAFLMISFGNLFGILH